MARAQRRTKNKNDNRKIAVYARKSKVTETGKSIEVQKEKCIALAKVRYDASESDILIYEDEGKSGFYADRPNYKKMLEDIRQNRLKAVICYKIDRISRRTVDLLNLVQQMDQKGIDFISVSDSDIDTTTRSGKIMISLLSAIAEFERDIIAERIADNMYELAKEGRWLGGTRPLGYESKKEKFTLNGRKTTVNHLESVVEEQKVVNELYTLFLQTASYKKTCDALNAKGYQTHKGNAFTKQAVQYILRNPVYAAADAEIRGYFLSFDINLWASDEDFDGIHGIMAYNKSEQLKELDDDSQVFDPKYKQKSLKRDINDWIVSVGKHRGIISGADWIKAQYLMKAISQKSSRPKETTKALLSGLVRCAVCGNRMYVKTESGRKNIDGSLRFRYDCSEKRYNKGCKGSPNVKGYELDNYVIEQICKMSEEDNLFFAQLMSTKKNLLVRTQETEKGLNTLKKRLARIETEIQNQIANLRTAPESVKQSIYADIEALGREREEKQNRINAIEEERRSQESQVADIEKAKQTIMEFPRLMKLVDYEGKLQLIHKIVEFVVVKDDEVHLFLKGTKNGGFFPEGKE